MLKLTKLIVSILVGSVFFFSCLTKKQWEQKYPCNPVIKTVVTIKDSIHHDTITKQVKVISPADSAAIKLAINCGDKKIDTVLIGNNNAKIHLIYRDRILTADCKCDSFAIRKSITDTITTHYKIKTITNTVKSDTTGLIAWWWIFVGLGIGFIVGFVMFNKK